MKKRDLRLAGLKYKLLEKKRNNSKNPVWKLTEEQIDFLENSGFVLVPRIYTIKTRLFMKAKENHAILKELHYARLNGKDRVHKRLNKNQIAVLRKFNVSYKPYKYEIVLN